MAVDVAALTNPSISAPLKFFVSFANVLGSKSDASFSFSRIFAVCIFRICSRPCSSGRPRIISCTDHVNCVKRGQNG